MLAESPPLASYAGGSGGKSSLGGTSLSSGLIMLRGRFDRGNESEDIGSGSSAEGTLVYLVLNGFGSLIVVNNINSKLCIQKKRKDNRWDYFVISKQQRD